MTQDCQTRQLSRQQVICQCQRPVTLHLTWQYRRNVCDLCDSCNTQLLITWVHRVPGVRVQIHTLRFSRRMAVSFFLGGLSYHLWSSEICLPSLTLPCSSYGTLGCRRAMLPSRVAGARSPSYVNLCGTDIEWILSHEDGQDHA